MEYREALRALKVVPIRELVLHEETVGPLTAHLKKAIGGSDKFTNPIVVDSRSYVVLDGTHRVKALSELGYKNIVCQMVDYFSPEIKVGAWYPVLRCANMTDLLEAVKTKKASFAKGMQEVRKMKAPFLLVFDRGRGKECHLAEPTAKPMKPDVLFALQKYVLAKFAHRHVIHYVPDEMHQKFLKTAGAVLLYRKHFSKEETLEIARDGELFPPKTTRHIIPMRVLGLDIPLSWLKLPAWEAQAKLDAVVRKRSETGAIRYYPEPTLVLNDYRFD